MRLQQPELDKPEPSKVKAFLSPSWRYSLCATAQPGNAVQKNTMREFHAKMTVSLEDLHLICLTLTAEASLISDKTLRMYFCTD